MVQWELSPSDLQYVKNGFSLNLVVMFEHQKRCTAQTLSASFDKVVLETPILQCRVIERDEQTLLFESKPTGWPKLVVEECKNVSTRQDLKQVVQERARKLAIAFSRDERMRRNTPIQMNVFKARNSLLGISVAAPHHFLDGVGLGSVVTKFVTYLQIPKPFWFVLGRFNNKELLNFSDMLLKNETVDLTNLNHQKSVRFHQNNFSFDAYEMRAADAQTHLRGYTGDLPKVSVQSIKKCRRKLRESKLTMTPALVALSVKVMAIILKENGDNTSDKPLLCSTGADSRDLGSWGDRRDKRKQFPVGGNFTFALFALIPFEVALSGSLNDIVALIQEPVQRIRSDATFRAQEALVAGLPPCGYFCGTSSFKLPSFVGPRIRNLEFDSRIDFGPVPHCWLYLITSKTHADAAIDIQLPIPSLTSSRVHAAFRQAIAHTPLNDLVGV